MNFRKLNNRLDKLLGRAHRELGAGKGSPWNLSWLSSDEVTRLWWLFRRHQAGGHPEPPRGVARMEELSPANHNHYQHKFETGGPAAVLPDAAMLPEEFLEELGIRTGPLTPEEEEELVRLLARAGFRPAAEAIEEAIRDEQAAEQPWQ